MFFSSFLSRDALIDGVPGIHPEYASSVSSALALRVLITEIPIELAIMAAVIIKAISVGIILASNHALRSSLCQ